ncbi:MAG: patatin-like protein [Erythrobacter sp.]
MRQKELRLALVCYGGVSLAVYMHGVTKEIWHLARASRNFHQGEQPAGGVQSVYQDLLETIQDRCQLRLRFLPDILTGASAGGINAVFLAQAINSGQSLEPLTKLWLENADIDELVDPEAEPLWRYAKIWAQPLAEWVLRRPGNAVSESVAKETRAEVREKVSKLVRGRWFEPPFSGSNFSELLFDALKAMEASELERPLLPPGHPIDLFVTATDFRGHLELLRLNSPPIVEETEHRLPIAFSGQAPVDAGRSLANLLELTMAARSTASFPGAFPPLQTREIDSLAVTREEAWTERDAFLKRIMPVHYRAGTADQISLIDGSVLVNAPFGGAMKALEGRPAQREVDRRFVYIDPRPDRYGAIKEDATSPVGFFAAIFGSLSTIPREQPIRDNLEQLELQSRDAERLKRIVAGLRPEVEAAVEKLFGRTLFLNRPTPPRLKNWRKKAQQAAAENAGYAYHSYAQAKFTSIIERLAKVTLQSAPQLGLPDSGPIEEALRRELESRGLISLAEAKGGANEAAIAFFREHDIGFRLRRMRLLARRLSRDWDADPSISDDALDLARETIFKILGLYFEREQTELLDESFESLALNVLSQPAKVLDHLAGARDLPAVDEIAEELLADAMEAMPRNLRRRMLLTYLGFPFYDVATFPLIRNEGLTEYDAVKIDRISPDDARSIRKGGTRATLKGTEFYNFGAFFSRDYRENDYLWGRLHGAERMVDLIASTLDDPMPSELLSDFKRRAFFAILQEEREAGRCKPALIEQLWSELEELYAAR